MTVVQPTTQQSRSHFRDPAEMKVLRAPASQFNHKHRHRGRTVCSTHGAGVAVPVQPAGSAAVEPSQLVTQVLELTANTGALQDCRTSSNMHIWVYSSHQPLATVWWQQACHVFRCACWWAPLLCIAMPYDTPLQLEVCTALEIRCHASADGGIELAQQQREQVDSLLEQLESLGSQQQPRPLDNPLLYGNYNVAYTSTSRAQSERGQRELAAAGSMPVDGRILLVGCFYTAWRSGQTQATDSRHTHRTAQQDSVCFQDRAAGHTKRLTCVVKPENGMCNL